MSNQRVLVLGASGMLGSAVSVEISRMLPDFELLLSARDRNKLAQVLPKLSGQPTIIDFELPSSASVGGTLSQLPPVNWIVNAIGITKPFINDVDGSSIERAIWINSMLPYFLDEWAHQHGAKVIQIATDCVYSGKSGAYRESSPHDALDVYGKTKSLGEPYGKATYLIRNSIIGPELVGGCYLLGWFLSQPQGATLKGFTNHLWNGVTTISFGKVCAGIMRNNLVLERLTHLVPAAPVTKFELLNIFAKYYRRTDLKIEASQAGEDVDRTLSTDHPQASQLLWSNAGYAEPPTIESMVEEMAAW
ncbi:MAG: sugar nucleotide-binding protein [Deltaproteobacteria bacterium]|nr:sugar nucleotide-binding protein [Deltaproteobacteria bacterium]